MFERVQRLVLSAGLENATPVKAESCEEPKSEFVGPVDANPAGFWDGLVAGWNGLVATLNGVVVALGFLIPWIAVVAVVGGLVWGVVVLVRRRRSPASED